MYYINVNNTTMANTRHVRALISHSCTNIYFMYYIFLNHTSFFYALFFFFFFWGAYPFCLYSDITFQFRAESF